MHFRIYRIAIVLAALAAAAAGQVKVTINPATATLRVGNEQQFSVSIAGSSDNGVNWYVNGIEGGNATVGTIRGGRYLPPAVLPNPNSVTVTVLHPSSGIYADAKVTILNPYPMLASVLPAQVRRGPFALTVNGSNFTSGAQVSMGSLTVTTTYVSPTRLMVSGVVDTSSASRVDLAVTNPDPGAASSTHVRVDVNPDDSFSPRVTAAAAGRFLEQAAFGPDRASVKEVQRLGFEGWIDAQFAEPASPFQDPAMINTSLGPVQARFFTNAVHGRDQLRQRVVFALSQIWVVSGSVVSQPARLVPFLRILQNDAFGNYRALMRDVTLSPAMGDYLNMVNNVKADPSKGTLANENYARELMQLFTIGTDMLNPDGAYVLDSAGQRIPSYTQKDVAEVARALTGWTYPTAPGARAAARNPARYDGPMEAWEPNHDSGSKTLLLGTVVPASQKASADLDAVLDNLFYHPNIAPFVCRNLIQHLVTSNPSPAYLRRVADAFVNSAGDRGDMRAVIKAILLDPEARQGDNGSQPAVSSGHLREPVLWIASLLRGLGALVNDTNGLASRGSSQGQNVFYAPSVFNYYSPDYRLPSGDLAGPEFQILSPATALDRANFVNSLIYGNLGAGATLILDTYTTLAMSPNDLLDEIDTVLFHGTMPSNVRRIILQAVIDTSGEKAKAQAALYLAASSGFYAVEN